MLAARKGEKWAETPSASASLKTGTADWTAVGADGPGADAWLTWQTWHVASLEAALWK